MKFVDGWWWPDQERHMIDWIADPKNRIMLNGRPSYQGKKQLAVLKRFEGRKDPIVMIDAGAHIGLWSFNFASRGAAVFAFEPVADHRACWRKNMAGFVGPGDIDDDSDGECAQLFPYALGERADMVSIRVNPTSTGDSWVKGKGEVEMRTIDSMEIPGVDFIKVDAEGYEEFILRGAENTIRADRPVICVEQKRDMAVKFGLKPRGAVEWLKKFGYRVREEIGGDYIMVPT